ncbi:MAG: surface-adhesin E family protein [Deltaproteobacteria bacterium]
MKHFLLTVSIVCLLMVGYTTANGAEWVHYGKDVLGNTLYYDKESITSGDKESKKVWSKKVYSDKGKEELIKEAIERRIYKYYGDLDYVLQLEVYNCNTKESGMVSVTLYSTTGKRIGSTSAPLELKPIIPEGISEALY